MPSESDSRRLQEKVLFLERDLEILREQMVDAWKRIDSVEKRLEHLTRTLLSFHRDEDEE